VSTAQGIARPVLGVSAAIFKDGRVLLAQRAGAPLAGLWSLPGGKVEPGERLAEAVAREVREEVGIDIAVGPLAGIAEVLPGAGTAGRHFVVLAYAAAWRSGVPGASEEVAAVRWADPQTLDGLEATPGLGAIVREAARLHGAGAP
jgi:ADP-ribose pyrophosphatase YjhB (NUDIX family)